MKELTQIKAEALAFQKQILDDLRPYMVTNDSFLNYKSWFVSSDNIFVKTQKEKLYIVAENAKKSYISYLEKNISFSKLPKTEIKVLPNEPFKILLEGSTTGDLRIELFFVEYSSDEKVKAHRIPLNAPIEIKTSKKTNKVRLALRLSGTGFGTIKKFQTIRKKVNKAEVAVSNVEGNSVIPKKIREIKMAGIFDEFSTTCFQEEVELITFRPDNWKLTLTKNRPHILMVESAWKGNLGSWEYKIAKYNNVDKSSLIELVKWCKNQGIPTIFWNKEDPVHFDRFVDTAKLFDYIFTTDANMISKYQTEVGHNNVFALPFSAQPAFHNPIKISEKRIEKISFAGSYYANRHADRKRDMEEMLDLAAEHGLDIYDRNYQKNKVSNNTDFKFPVRFSDNIKGSLKYDEIEKAYKGYKVMLNVNSIKYSPTMFSRRVFEGLASGTPILSSYSEGIKRIFKEIVLVSENKEMLKNNLDKLMNEEQFYREKSLEGIREVYLHHTYKHRIKNILDKVGIKVVTSAPEVTVIAVANSKEEFYYLLTQYSSQTWKSKKLLLLLNNFEGYIEILNKYNQGDISAYVLSYMKHYKRIYEITNTEYIGFFNAKDYYGENYLMDMMIATQYSKAEIIGKNNRFLFNKQLSEINPGCEYEYVNDLKLTSSVINKKIFKGIDLTSIMLKVKESGNLNEFFKKGYQLLSVDKYNYVENGHLIENKQKEIIEI
ncbi:CgeB family protein [Oceanobacillus kapialis]|uniref:Glycosyltransferase n=1 Tax=Oceanobacillus kapialis TaxID=481353 RepID=A0ABW5PWY5_9BACI